MNILSRRMMVRSVMSASLLALLAGTGWAQTSNPEPPSRPLIHTFHCLATSDENCSGGLVFVLPFPTNTTRGA